MTGFPPPPVLASTDALRPVFLILMGLTLLSVAWRLTRASSGWPAGLMRTGALLLALGYSVILPLYSARVLLPLDGLRIGSEAGVVPVVSWHLAKTFAMNAGWLLFGIGLALHAGVFGTSRRFAFTPAPHAP